uniref:ribonuclease H n=1 Tax=Plectus sambesii TaxID=2011161 RepID=A0A914VED9_9BILA
MLLAHLPTELLVRVHRALMVAIALNIFSKTFDKNGRLEIFVAGACPRHGLPGAKGGVGVWAGDGVRHPFNVSRRLQVGHQSRNRAKLMAAYEGLRLAKEMGSVVKVRLFTHSQLIYYGLRSYVYEWEENGWQTDDHRPVENCDLWK